MDNAGLQSHKCVKCVFLQEFEGVKTQKPGIAGLIALVIKDILIHSSVSLSI